MFYIIFDFCMAAIMLLFGIWFYKSGGKAADERRKYDEDAMCKAYGKRMMYMSIPFLIGISLDFRYPGIGCLIAWGMWLVLFILLLIERHKREQ